MRFPILRTEAQLAAGCTVLLLLALFGPAVAQPAGLHGYADLRVLWGVPFAADVLSNLAFALAGLLGLRALHRLPVPALSPVQRACAGLFFVGLLLTAAGSAWYHWGPDDAGLAVDRLAMGVAFAGLLGLLAAAQVSERAGTALGLGLLVLAPLAVATWLATGNVLPWAVLQFGGLLLVLALGFLPGRPLGLPVRWGWIVLAYALAKGFEVADHAVFELTGQWLAGHTAKHLIAAAAAWPVIAALNERARGQNGRAGSGVPVVRVGRA